MSRLRLAFLLALIFPSFAAFAADSPALTSAIALFDAKRVPEARDLFAAIVAKQPKNVSALWYLGRCDLKLQHREAAATTLAKAAELAPDNALIVADYGTASLLRATELGTTFGAIGFARRGRNALEQAVKLSPDTIAYREGLVQFYTRAPGFAGGSFEKAYAHIAEITKRDPIRGTVLRANVLCSEKRYDEALAACETFLRDHPDTYLALYTIGRIVSETGRDIAKGEAALRRCLEIPARPEEPDHAGARYRLGLIAEKDNRPADARREYQAALALEPSLDKATEALARLK
ncbi:tetratricopeptide repeat protein [Rariglobus hedericola]|uniref:Tetratricopeptide repeat protein n=1 Tax=Rariglobus hedericola TaxID=2597822 RepID=A0A556QML7_9BACT|nr:tetratricopeptide repeat protein [Rariglobus hedericola]TSJ77875.1 tetratricopeptide repeat protein [Rariglobus hedericola]